MLAAAWRFVSPHPHLSRRTSLTFRIGNLLVGILASFLGDQKVKNTRFPRDYLASLRNFSSQSGHLSEQGAKSGRLPVNTRAESLGKAQPSWADRISQYFYWLAIGLSIALFLSP